MVEKKAKEKRIRLNDEFCRTVREDGIHIDSED